MSDPVGPRLEMCDAAVPEEVAPVRLTVTVIVSLATPEYVCEPVTPNGPPTVVGAVTVRDQTENRVLYDNQNFVFRGEYEFASDPRSFFNEEDPAILRMSRNFAESIVSTLINAVQIEKK